MITQVFETSPLFGTTQVNVIQATLDPNGAGGGETTTPVPEPASLALLGTGIAGLIAASSSQQRHTS